MNQKRDGNVIPMNRGGGASRAGSDVATPTTEMEKNAPVFSTLREREQWLDGKPTRREVIADVKKLQEWAGYISARLEQVTEPLEALKRLLVKRGVISQEEFAAEATLQLNFKRLLDSINFTPNLPMPEKIQLVQSWNGEHPEMRIRGAYVRGLKEHLLDPKSGLSLQERAEIASEVGFKEEDVLSEGEMVELAAQLAEAPITTAEAEADPEQAKTLLEEAGLSPAPEKTED